MKKILVILLSLILVTGCTSNNKYKGEINVLNWSAYIPDSVIRDFEKEYIIF